MLMCNCTLCYNNPDACKSCSVYLKEFGNTETKWVWDSEWWNIYFPNTIDIKPTYNPETHELVEKKEAKIKRLTQEIQDAKELLEAKSKFFDDEILKMKQLSAEIEELEKELKEAEK